HNELGVSDDTNPASDGIQQSFTNKEQEGRVETQLAPFNLRFAALTTAIGIQGGHQELTAPSPNGIGLWDPNSNWRIAGYTFNEFKFSEATKAQIAGRIEQVSLSGVGRNFDAAGLVSSTPLDRTGKVVASRIARTSGSAALDQETIDTVRRAQPFPSPPPNMPGETFEFTVPSASTSAET